MTHTFAEIEVPAEFYDFVVRKLVEVAGSPLASDAGAGPIDMHGLALTRGPASEKPALANAPLGAPDMDGWEWAIVEVFGHRRHAGRAREEERFGSKMLRIDVPIKGNAAANGWETHWYGGASIFSYTLTDEATAIKINTPYAAPTPYLLSSDRDDGDEDSGPE